MIIGYARVSTEEQLLDSQIDALKIAGCEKIFSEICSTRDSRPELEQAMKFLRKNDTFVFWKLDRVGRSLKELVIMIDDLNKRGVFVKCITQQIVDTTTASGKLNFSIIAAFAEFERELIRERTIAGLSAAVARGRLGGRPKSLNYSADPVKYAVAKDLLANSNKSVKEIAKILGMSKSTLYRYFKGGKTAITNLDDNKNI